MRRGTILFVHSIGSQSKKGEGSYDLVNYLKREFYPDFEILHAIISDPESPTYPIWRRTLNNALKELHPTGNLDRPFIRRGCNAS